MAGELVFFEVRVDHAEAARVFYGDLFGWRFAEDNFPGYYMVSGSVPGGGLNGTGESPGIHVYFNAPDIGESVRRVRELGGQAEEPVGIPSGTYARCRDAEGNSFSLWQGPEDGGVAS